MLILAFVTSVLASVAVAVEMAFVVLFCDADTFTLSHFPLRMLPLFQLLLRG